MTTLKTAVLDLYDGHPNQGMRCINQALDHQRFGISRDVYRVRDHNEIPSLDYDVFIFSGGPGDPLETDKPWCNGLLSLIDRLFEYNQKKQGPAKHVFFICHAFQIVCHHLGIADVCLRKSPAFGIFPVHKTRAAGSDPVFGSLPEPFYAVDSRDWQVVKPAKEKIRSLGAKVVAIEKKRPHVELERAVMAIRFSDCIIGTQFHPEADVTGMRYYFKKDDKKKQIIKNHGAKKYHDMMALLDQDDKILLTYNHILPEFLKQAHAARQ